MQVIHTITRITFGHVIVKCRYTNDLAFVITSAHVILIPAVKCTKSAGRCCKSNNNNNNNNWNYGYIYIYTLPLHGLRTHPRTRAHAPVYCTTIYLSVRARTHAHAHVSVWIWNSCKGSPNALQYIHLPLTCAHVRACKGI